MALVDNAWYVDYGNGTSTGYYSVGKWTALTAYAAGQIIRQNAAPAVNSERCFVCIIAGTTLASEPGSWGTTRGAKTAEAAGPTWQECTGVAALNGDASTNTPNWTTVKNTSITLGQVIQRNNGASFQICSTAGTAGNGSEPAFSDTAGTTTADNTATWTSLGVVGNFTGWQAPHARLKNAYAANWGQAGNAFFVASEHGETQAASNVLLSPGSSPSNPCFVYCVTKTTVPPVSANLTTGASLSTTGSSDIFIQGNTYYQGITMNAGDSSNANGIYLSDGSAYWTKMKNCTLQIRNTGATSGAKLSVGSRSNQSDCVVWLENTTIQFTNTSQGIILASCAFTWKNTASALAGATFPTSLIKGNANAGGSAFIEGVDLSALGSGKTIVASLGEPIITTLKDCKLGASVTVAATPAEPGQETILIDCDSAGTNYRAEKYTYMGTQTIETTIVRTGGASNGTTSVAWKIVTTANSKWVMPYEALPIAIWNDTTGANVTITVYGIWGGGAVPNNDDIWFEAEYLGSSATPQASFSTVTKADNLAAGTALPTDTSTWGGSTTKFKMTLTLSAPQPAQKGPIYIYVKAAKASSTFYIDPLAVLS